MLTGDAFRNNSFLSLFTPILPRALLSQVRRCSTRCNGEGRQQWNLVIFSPGDLAGGHSFSSRQKLSLCRLPVVVVVVVSGLMSDHSSALFWCSQHKYARMRAAPSPPPSPPPPPPPPPRLCSRVGAKKAASSAAVLSSSPRGPTKRLLFSQRGPLLPTARPTRRTSFSLLAPLPSSPPT